MNNLKQTIEKGEKQVEEISLKLFGFYSKELDIEENMREVNVVEVLNVIRQALTKRENAIIESVVDMIDKIEKLSTELSKLPLGESGSIRRMEIDEEIHSILKDLKAKITPTQDE